MDLSFWQGRRVLVTGHTGFKGAWLAVWLQKLEAEVTGFALAPPSGRPSLFEAAAVARGMRSLEGDLRNLDAVRSAVAEARPEIVLHLAAQALVHEGYREPLATFSTNVLGTAHLLEAARHSRDARAVVSVTSDKCYANQERPEKGYREGDPLGGRDPYSSSKACAELVTAAYRSSFLQRPPEGRQTVWTATARAGNVIGGGDWAADRLVPDLVRGFLSGRPVKIRRPDATRPWQHVLEPLRGYLALAERLATEGEPFAEAWNFGPREEDAKPVRWVADRMVARWGGGARWVVDGEAHPPEATYLKLDVTKAGERLGWRPTLPLEEALDWVVDWYRAHAEGGDGAALRALTERQITAYEERL